MKRFIFSILLLIVAITVNSTAQWSTNPTVNTAICTSTGDQQGVQFCESSDGGYIIVWRDTRSGNQDIYAQKINAYGFVQWTANGVAICTETGNQANPTVISDGSGGAIITWDDARSGTADIYAQRINSSGTVQWTAGGVLVCNATGAQSVPTIASDGSTGAIITWYDGRGAANDIYAQKINSSGASQWTANGVVICNATSNQYLPQILADGSGGAFISWWDARTDGGDIYMQRVNSDGVVQWTANGVVICNSIGTQYISSFISDGAGGTIISWYDSDIFAQRINSSGVVQWTANGVVICNASGSQYYPMLTTDGSNGAIITWQDGRNATMDIYAQRINSSGTVQWTANGLSICGATGSQSGPMIITDNSNGAIIAWTDQRIAQTHIYSQRINSAGTSQWTADGVGTGMATGFQVNPVILPHSNGGAVLAWSDYRSGYDIYAQYITAGGELGVMKPTVTTATISTIGITTATGGGNVTSDGGANVSARGVCWNTSTNPTTSNGSTSDGSGTGTFISDLTNLAPNTLHYVRAYATNSAGTSYGDNVTFTTIPTLPEWGLIALITLSAGFGGWIIWRRFI